MKLRAEIADLECDLKKKKVDLAIVRLKEHEDKVVRGLKENSPFGVITIMFAIKEGMLGDRLWYESDDGCYNSPRVYFNSPDDELDRFKDFCSELDQAIFQDMKISNSPKVFRIFEDLATGDIGDKISHDINNGLTALGMADVEFPIAELIRVKVNAGGEFSSVVWNATLNDKYNQRYFDKVLDIFMANAGEIIVDSMNGLVNERHIDMGYEYK